MQVDGYSLDAQRDKLRKYAAYEEDKGDHECAERSEQGGEDVSS